MIRVFYVLYRENNSVALGIQGTTREICPYFKFLILNDKGILLLMERTAIWSAHCFHLSRSYWSLG